MPADAAWKSIAGVFVLSLVAAFAVRAAAVAESNNPNQESGYLDVGGSKIYYEESGSRERTLRLDGDLPGREAGERDWVSRGSDPTTIVLLHDGLLGAVSWDEVWGKLAGTYHVIRYDRRGYGRSEPATHSYSPTEDLCKLLTYLKVQGAVVVGSSSGGALAIDFAIEHPDMINGLFLIGPVLHGMPYTQSFLERAHRNSEPMEHRGDIKAAAKNWSEDRFLIANGHDPARKKFYDALIASPQNLKYDPQFEQKLSPPASQRLGEIKAPTIILAGESDINDVHAHCEAINAGIHDSQRVVVKDAGHLVQLEKPDEMVSRLTEFAAKIKVRIKKRAGGS